MSIYTRRAEPLTEREIAALKVHFRRGRSAQRRLEMQQAAAAKDLRKSTLKIKARLKREENERIAREKARQRLALPDDSNELFDYGESVGVSDRDFLEEMEARQE